MAETQVGSTGILYSLSDLVGASEPSLRLLLSLLAGYPLLYFHQKYLRDKHHLLQHWYFIAGGLGIALFNNGLYVIHSLICIFFAWLTLLFVGGTLLSVVISFIFLMGYLLIGYYYTGTDTYDIKWTMPHCVLTLRLIALAFDLYDGFKKTESLSVDEQKTALKIRPSLVEIASHTFFPPSFMVGPQFSMRRYQDFIKRTLYPADTPSPFTAGLLRGFYGLIYLIVYQIGITFIPDSYLISPSYMALPFWKRFFMVGLWGKISLYKYIACWLITEGACIFSGLAYSGTDKGGHPVWKGCSNIRIFICESATQFGILIQGFNINTNAWVAKYVYKRLKFLNNRYFSQVTSLMFLAVWHGFHSGYYACFFMEFIIMYMEKRIGMILSRYPQVVSILQMPPLSYILLAVMKLYVFLFMGYCLGSFALLKMKYWWKFYTSLYFIGHVFFLSWIPLEPLFKLMLLKVFGPPKSKEEIKCQSSNVVGKEDGKKDS